MAETCSRLDHHDYTVGESETTHRLNAYTYTVDCRHYKQATDRNRPVNACLRNTEITHFVSELTIMVAQMDK